MFNREKRHFRKITLITSSITWNIYNAEIFFYGADPLQIKLEIRDSVLISWENSNANRCHFPLT